MNGDSAATTKVRLRNAAAAFLMRSPLLRVMQSRASPPWRILTYHRVVDPESVAYPLQPGMYVRPATFRRHMKFLQKSASVVTLDALLSRIKEGADVPVRTVVVTIDDGWRDNYTNAFPILRETGVPATICLATSYIGSLSVFWTDRVAQSISALRHEAEFRRPVLDRIGGTSELSLPLRSQLKDAAGGTGDTAQVCDALVESLKGCTPAERTLAVELLSVLAKEFSELPSERFFMSWQEVSEMSRSGVSFVSHSHHHQNMTELSEEHLRDEVIDSQQALREAGLSPPPVLCYPGGYHNKVTQRVLEQEGIRFALGTMRRSVPGSRPQLLGRVSIHEDITATVPAYAARIWVGGF